MNRIKNSNLFLFKKKYNALLCNDFKFCCAFALLIAHSICIFIGVYVLMNCSLYK